MSITKTRTNCSIENTSGASSFDPICFAWDPHTSTPTITPPPTSVMNTNLSARTARLPPVCPLLCPRRPLLRLSVAPRGCHVFSPRARKAEKGGEERGTKQMSEDERIGFCFQTCIHIICVYMVHTAASCCLHRKTGLDAESMGLEMGVLTPRLSQLQCLVWVWFTQKLAGGSGPTPAMEGPFVGGVQNIHPQTLHGTAISADQLAPLAPPLAVLKAVRHGSSRRVVSGI